MSPLEVKAHLLMGSFPVGKFNAVTKNDIKPVLLEMGLEIVREWGKLYMVKLPKGWSLALRPEHPFYVLLNVKGEFVLISQLDRGFTSFEVPE